MTKRALHRLAIYAVLALLLLAGQLAGLQPGANASPPTSGTDALLRLLHADESGALLEFRGPELHLEYVPLDGRT